MSDASEASPGADATGPAPGTETPQPAPPRRRDPAFRVELVKRVPRLGFTSWSPREDFKVDREWAGIVALGSDAVLGPLEPLAPPPPSRRLDEPG